MAAAEAGSTTTSTTGQGPAAPCGPTRVPARKTTRITEEGKAACVAFFEQFREALKDGLKVEKELQKWQEYITLVRTHNLKRAQVYLQFTNWRDGLALGQSCGQSLGNKSLFQSMLNRLEARQGGLKKIVENVVERAHKSYLVTEGGEMMFQMIVALVCSSDAALQFWMDRIYELLEIMVELFPQSQSKITYSTTLFAARIENTRILNMPKFMEQAFVIAASDKWFHQWFTKIFK